MSSSVELVVRVARSDDVAAICQFGDTHVRPHYTPLIGAAAADGQVRSWWHQAHFEAAVTAGLVVVAAADGHVVGVGERGYWEAEHVIWKLYLDPAHRGQGLGLRLLDALIRQLPADAARLYLEHFAANTRAAAFYEREGFTVERVEPNRDGDPALDVVWRARPVVRDR